MATGAEPTGAEKRRTLLVQLIRYGILGVFVTLCGQSAYVALDTFTAAPIQLCNVAGFVVSLVIGYNLHSRYTFRDQGERGWPAFLRFFLAALPSYAVNAFWTWLIITALKLPHIAVQVPIFCITPFMIFAINRWWVFK
jgi:putative flippase GtrA